MQLSTPFFTSALVVSLLGCGDERVSGPVEIQKVESSANPCGEWQLAVRAQGHGAALVLEVNGHRHREWSVEGEVDLVTDGQASPGEAISMELVASNTRHALELQMPPLIAKLHGEFASPPDSEETALPLLLRIESPCLLRVAIPWSLQVDGEELHSGRFIPGSPQVVVEIPPLSPGPHTIEATASWGGSRISTWSQSTAPQPDPSPPNPSPPDPSSSAP